MENNWYGFSHDAVAKRFEGDLTDLNDFCVYDEYLPVAVYSVESPNRDKGHKDFVLLQIQDKQLLIRGLDREEMEKWRYQDAIVCEQCKDVIYSVMKHDYRLCQCNRVAIDGGSSYTKITGTDYTLGTIDLLTNQFFLP